MTTGIHDVSRLLWADGQQVTLSYAKTGPTTGTLTWTLPTNPKVYNGIVITASLREINPSNYPTDSVIYTPSADFAVPADLIGQAQVVVAVYNDVTTLTATLTNMTPNVAYFFSAHAVSNVLTYYSIGVKSYPESLDNPAYAGDIQKLFSPPTSPTVGEVYFDEVQKLVFVWDGSTWTPTTSSSCITGAFDPVAPFTGLPTGFPALGDFFYNITTRTLKMWNGTTWILTSSSSGVPMYAKQDVGTDLTYAARANLIAILKKQLGYPAICVELTEDQFNIAVDNALQEIRRRTDVAYTKEYFFMQIHPMQDLYYLNDPGVGTDRIVDVLKIHRLNMMGLVNFGPDNIYAQQFLSQFYSPGVGYDLVSIHLVHSMSELYSQLFAGEISFNWREARRTLQLNRKFSTNEKVLVESSCEKLEQEILTDRWMQQWIQQWAEAELMFTLANIRGKFATLPGPGGALALNADTLIAEATRYQDDCLRQIKDYEVGQNGPDNWYMPFTIG